MKKFKIKVKKPWIAYPGSAIQQNYAEDLNHGYLLWDIQDKNDFAVKFRELPNDKPFVTVEWQGDVDSTIEFCKTFKKESRFRIYNQQQLSHKDVVLLTNELKLKLNATEVTYKTDSIASSNVISAYNTTIVKNDLRNSDILFKLFSEYYAGTLFENQEIEDVNTLIKTYVSQLKSEEIVRNSTWSLKHLKFDNVLAYGEANVIDFEKLSGIVGIFGPNRIGKSSIVGTIMYSLFNSSDRGTLKNAHVVNMRKPHCYSRLVLNSDGVDYVVERQTVKSQNKKGQTLSSTALNVFKLLNGEAIDLVGEQRTDTEKVIKSIIGTQDDFLLTSLSAQDEIKLFISQGSTKRRQVLTRFLDLDVFDKLFDFAKSDLNSYKILLKAIPEKDWQEVEKNLNEKIISLDDKIKSNTSSIDYFSIALDSLKSDLSKHGHYVVITATQISEQNNKVNSLISKFNNLEKSLSENQEKSLDLDEKIKIINDTLKKIDIDDLSKDLEKIEDLKSKISNNKHTIEKKNIQLKQSQKSLKILEGIPCGDTFPTCKFIKDAYGAKSEVIALDESIKSIDEKINSFQIKLDDLKHQDVIASISKYEKLNKLLSNYELEYSRLSNEITKCENELTNAGIALDNEKKVLENLKASADKEENLDVISIKSKIVEMQSDLNFLHKENVALASELGKTQFLLQRTVEEKLKRDELLHNSKMCDLVLNAFSKKGIPSKIIAAQLPMINSEISKILHGIVDFSVELEHDDETDSMEVYINYGDSKRLIELGSGMEKMIASIAIRVALINVSTLPKTDMFIIDEGFGALDEQGVESCNRLLMLLKKYFKTVIVITHVEGIKDSADIIIEVSKVEKDAKIVYE